MPDVLLVCQDALASAMLAVAEAQTSMAERMVRGADISEEHHKVHAALHLATRARASLEQARQSATRAEEAERHRIRSALLEALESGPQPSRRDVVRAARLPASAMPALSALIDQGAVSFTQGTGYALASAGA